MKSVIALSAVLASATAFAPVTPFMGSRMAVRPSMSTQMSMSAEDMVGASAPLGFFDPMGFSKGPVERLNNYREAELKHGRVAMLAVVGFLTQESYHPLYNGSLSSNPLKAIFEVPAEGIVQIIAFIGFLEFVCGKIKSGPTYIPGDYLGSSDLFEGEGDSNWISYQTKELNNGRLAMFAIMGLITHNMLTGGQGAFEQIKNGVYPF
ncbi:unnamed protein product [Discosporangium mesarthrocarpum]